MNYWYAALPNEIFLDLDSRRALMRCMKVLRAAKMQLLGSKVRAVFHYPTGRKGHCHVVIQLGSGTSCQNSAIRRAILGLWLGSDRLRGCYVLSRILTDAEIVSADLLMSQREYHRPPDWICGCPRGRKHKAKAATSKCGALKGLLGELQSKDFFPRAGKQKLQPLRIPIGAVSLNLIRRWKRG